MAKHKNILLIISGSIAAYKVLDLIRMLREQQMNVEVILTKGGAEFITPLAVSSISGNQTYSDLFSLKDEVDMGHIRLSREADLIVVAPASADLIAKMANGLCGDLATTTLLATDKPVMVAPAMNHKMWEHSATKRNVEQLESDGIEIIQPEAGTLACGETGVGRMASSEVIFSTILQKLSHKKGALSGKSAIVTSGPTHELIDPVRFIGNRSSGKQGYAIAEALADAGAKVTLISGPTALDTPDDASRIDVKTAEEMYQASLSSLPADIAVFAAAVADWRPDVRAEQKLKKSQLAGRTPEIELTETTDILAAISQHQTKRPELVIGFAAETENVLQNASDKRERKECDWLLANDTGGGKVFGKDETSLYFITDDKEEEWFNIQKTDAAEKLVKKIIGHFRPNKNTNSDIPNKKPANIRIAKS